MNKKILFAALALFFLLIIFNSQIYSQTPEGDYQVGDTKCSIKLDEESNWRVYWEGVEGSTKLTYKENMVTGEQVWIEKKRGKVIGNFILNNNYTSGRYVRLSDDAKIDVVKIQ